jgi:quercetin dioxygenase-like cupin family protein
MLDDPERAMSGATRLTAETFSRDLARAGFNEPIVVERGPNESLDEHAHPFEARALILEGEITLSLEGRETVYRAGDVFHLPHGARHIEKYGPTGVRYLVGRK